MSQHVIKPYDNEQQVVQINGLTIENRVDQLSIYGTVNLTRDKVGFQKLLELKTIIDDAYKILCNEELPAAIIIEKPKKVPNPF